MSAAKHYVVRHRRQAANDVAPARRHRSKRVARPPLQHYDERPPPGLVRRFLTTHRHLFGLLAGGLIALDRQRQVTKARVSIRGVLIRALAALVRPFIRRDLRDLPFPVQLRRRMELLGPTYIKLGQILSLREDLLPHAITEELRRLLDQLPVVPYERFVELVEDNLERPIASMFRGIDPLPLGSASIAQIHRAETLGGDEVVLKVVKPGIPTLLRRDARLLRALAALLQVVIPHYQPRRIVGEFVDYTMREVDLEREATNAETFAANFADRDDVVFPRIYREYSASRVLCMEFIDGMRPDCDEARALPVEERERLVDVGAASIIRMIYRDGFFHADLHPGNLMILPGPKVGFIDLGMVGQLDGDLRHLLLYYYYSLVMGDAESAARYLTAVAEAGPRSDVAGFRREVTEISGRWRRAARFETFSLAQLILESLSRGAHYHMYFPVELVLMVKALITFEGVGHVLLPDIDVAKVSRRHIRGIFLGQFNPVRVVREELRGAPDLLDAAVKLPLLVTEGLRVLERSARAPAPSPFVGLRSTLLAGFALHGAVILFALGRPWPVWSLLLGSAVVLATRRGGA
jgi:ubiquinone biosynthesis protein